MSVLERFEAKYIPEPNSGCWIWLSHLDKKGYGQFYLPPRNMVRAHTAAWELYRGSRKELCVLHSCDVRCCVNPDHLRLGTHQENMNDRERRKRREPPQGVKNGRATISEETVRAIRNDKRSPRLMVRDYGVPYSTLQKIRNRQTWRHIP